MPGEFRNALRRIIVTQGDTEPASVEQQRRLGHTCPSLYDLRNLFQVNVEEGRHLWAMVYLLHKYFGRDGRDEADALLERRSGNPDKPRILEAFNQPCDDWLNFFCFTMFTDRDGKYQLSALAESGFEPLARTCQFMLTEEAHHLFVGETGVGRVVQRTAELMKQNPNEDVRALGRHPARHHPAPHQLLVLLLARPLRRRDQLELRRLLRRGPEGALSGAEEVRRARPQRTTRSRCSVVEDGRLVRREVPLRNALNEVLRGEYVADCERALDRWNEYLAEEGVAERLTPAEHALPPPRRRVRRPPLRPRRQPRRRRRVRGAAAPNGSRAADDREYLQSIMRPVTEPGKIANWIAPPATGIKGKPFEFEYVRL